MRILAPVWNWKNAALTARARHFSELTSTCRIANARLALEMPAEAGQIRVFGASILL
ncbi:MAG: hypothetical protein QM778_27785 [Myxococcales bacterium]